MQKHILITGFAPGSTYRYVAGDSDALTTDNENGGPTGVSIAEGLFVATQRDYYLWATDKTGETTAKIYAIRSPLAYCRFNDPNGVDVTILVTGEYRTAEGQDGGRGRAWRIASGQMPIEIPMNGHDVDSESRLIPCFNGVALVRPQKERHYIYVAAPASETTGPVDLVNSQIQLNCAPEWNDGDAVRYKQVSDGFLVGANPDTIYYVKNIAGNKIELYSDPGLTTQIEFTDAFGSIYFERNAAEPGPYGNGSPTLLMQPTAEGLTAIDTGFKSVPTRLYALDFNSDTKVLRVENHRFIPGNQIVYHDVSGPTETTYYVRPVNEHGFTVHLTVDDALANNAPQDVSFGIDDYVVKDEASSMPMPPAREAAYTENGCMIQVNGKNNITVSDPNDPVHHSPFSGDFLANLGESDAMVTVLPFALDTVLFIKTGRVLILNNFSKGPSEWQLDKVATDYGCVSARAAVLRGKDAWIFSRKGVMSVVQTAQGKIQGTTWPVSAEMKKYVDQIDWKNASIACAENWNNRYFLSVPLKGQTGEVKNNALFVHYSRPVKDQSGNITGYDQGWEGAWTGNVLNAYQLIVHNVAGEERLCFVDYDGRVCFLGEGWTDYDGADVQDELTTRIYTGGNLRRKSWLKANIIWETWNPQLTVRAATPGVNEGETIFTDRTYDPTKYRVDDVADYDPETSTEETFDAPYREDYSPTASELMVSKLDVHQVTTEPVRMRLDDYGVQMILSNTQGSARVVSVEVEGAMRAGGAAKQV